MGFKRVCVESKRRKKSSLSVTNEQERDEAGYQDVGAFTVTEKVDLMATRKARIRLGEKTSEGMG